MTAIWIDGAVIEAAAAHVSVFDHGFTVGDGVFETLKVVDGRPFALTRHLRRLTTSARGLGLPDPDLDRVRRAASDVLAATAPEPLQRLRITYTGGESPLGSARGTAPPTLVVAAASIEPPAGSAAVVTVPWTRNERSATAGLKTTSYAENVVALAHAKVRGASEAIFGNTHGELCEGTGSNVFVVVGGRLLTPPLASGCLAGVTRELLLEWTGAQEERLPLDVLATAEEIALASSTRDLQPVHDVDGRPLGAPGRVVNAALDAFRARSKQNDDP